MKARADIDQYYGAAETMTNVFPLPHGGFTRRPGLEYIAELPDTLTRHTGQTITAPNGGTASNANDDSITTLVTTTNNVSTTNPYVVVHYDLGSSKSIKFIDVMEASLTSGTSDTEFKIQVSTDNTNWTTLATVPLTTAPARNKRIRVDASYRYIRFARIGTTDLGTAKVNLGELWIWQETGTLSEARLAEFAFNTTQTYMLLLTDRNAAIYKDGVHQADAYIPHTSAQLDGVGWTQNADTLILFHEEVSPRNLKRIASDIDWYGSQLLFDYTPRYNFVPAEDNPAQTLTPSATTGNITLTTGGAVWSSADVGQYVSGNSGRARIVRYTSTTVVDAVVEIPFFDTGAIASGDWTRESGYENVWSSTRGYPRCGVFHDGRLWLAGSTQRPSTIWGSRVGLFYDFDPGSVLDDDAIDATLDTGQFNKVLNLYSGRTLTIFTTGGEHAVLQQLNEAITPGNFNAKKQTSVGSREGLRVVEVDGNIIYVQREGESVQEFVYSDTQQSFISNIVSLISSHLIITPVDMALRKATSNSDGNYLCVVNSDGTMTVACLQASQLIAAFARQTTEGDFLAVGVDNGDIYTVVERDIGSTTKRFLERFNASHTLDCSKRDTSTSVPGTSMSELEHLAGIDEVMIKVDDEDVFPGEITFGDTADFTSLYNGKDDIVITIATGATSNTATVTAVDSQRALLLWGGFTTTDTASASGFDSILPRITLTNSTTLTATRGASDASFTTTVRARLMEFAPGMMERVQYGTITIAANADSGISTLATDIDLATSAVFFLGVTTDSATALASECLATVEIGNANTIIAKRAYPAASALTVSYAVGQFRKGVINRIQQRTARFSGTGLTGTDTITSVDLNNSMIAWGGIRAHSNTLADSAFRLQQTAPGTITFTRVGTDPRQVEINYTSIEFVSSILASVQRGDTPIASATSADETITTAGDAMISQLGFSTNATASRELYPTVEQSTTTNVKSRKNTAGTVTTTPAWEVANLASASQDATASIEVGLDYTPVVKDLPLEDVRLGTASGLKKNTSEINLELYQTKNITLNGKRLDFNGFNETVTSSGFTGIKRTKGQRGWDLTGQVTISQDKALPMTVLSIAKKVNT
jgi:hypothetical protein